MPHNDDPDEEYSMPDESMFANTVYIYAAQKERIEKLKRAIDEIQILVDSLPSGIDYEADPCNTSPADAVAFTGGLIWQICERVR